MSRPVLHHDLIVASGASPDRWMLLLPGIYGAGRNWQSIARAFVRERTDWGVVTVDLRQHGRSPRFQPPHTVQACADDLFELERSLALESEAVLGHSFGGKVALLYAREAPGLGRAWIVDSTPDARPPSGSAWRMLRVLRLHSEPFPDRAAVIAAVESEGFDDSVAQWMSTNAVPGEDGLTWRIDPDDMEELLRDFFRTDVWSVVENPPPNVTVHMVRATRSSVMDDEAAERVRGAAALTGRVYLHEVEGGHWLNADNPEALHSLLTRHM
jgi:pimeloyl-ACP methyl ester carboxylesterase